MKITQNKNRLSKKTFLIIAGVVVILAAGSVATALYLNSQRHKNATDTKNVDNTSSIKEGDGKAQDNNANNGTLPSKGQDSTENGTTTPNQPTTPSGDIEKPNLIRADYTNSNVKIVATFTKPSTGQCEAIFTKSGQANITKVAQIVVGPDYYYCSFSIPGSEFSSTGDWSVSIIHQLGSSTAISDTKTISL